jgi:integrase
VITAVTIQTIKIASVYANNIILSYFSVQCYTEVSGEHRLKANKTLASTEGIRLYRRHSADCKRDDLKCRCPLWIQFQRGGKQVRESAKTRELEQAYVLVKKVERELKGEIPVTTKISLVDAVAKWLKHREQEGIGNDRAKNMSDRLIKFCKDRQIVSLAAITKTHLSEFKLSLDLRSGDSNSLRISLSVIGGLFRWATEEAGYLSANPFPRFKLKFTPREVVPPTTEEVNRVLAEAEDIRQFANLMRWSGMAIRDAVTLRRNALVGNLITAQRIKTDRPFRVRIPLWLADELRALPPVNAEYFFWDGKTDLHTFTMRYSRMLTEVFKRAGVKMTSHRFRHFFISSMLAVGKSVEDVSTMVGTSPDEIRGTYRHFIKEATERLDREQETAWLAMGLDKDGNPRTATIQ